MLPDDSADDWRAGVVTLLVGLSAALVLSFVIPPDGDRSPKVNATLFACGVGGALVAVLSGRRVSLKTPDKLLATTVGVMSIGTLLRVDYGAALLGGRVATPLLVAIVALLMVAFGKGHGDSR